MNLRSFLGGGQRPPDQPPVSDPRALRGEPDAQAQAVMKFLSQTGLFDRAHYARVYPDVARSGLDPLHHFARVGIHAGCQFTTPETIARLWREVLTAPAKAALAAAVDSPERFKVALYVSSLGNFFFREMAEILTAGFAEAGIACAIHDENGTPARGATHHVVIAPHEFFTLGEGKRWANDEFVARAVLFATEQIQTPWFARSLLFLLHARAIADMNEQTAAILRKAGLRAAAVQPGFTANFKPFAEEGAAANAPVFEALGPAFRRFDTTADVFADRPLDIAFLGTQSLRREKWLATYAPKFAALKTFIYYGRNTGPLARQNNPMASSDVTAALLRRTKVLLNLHRDEYTYLEWWRVMQAFWLKAVVVSEPCFPHPVFKPGVHYFEEAPRHIHHLAAWLVETPDGRAAAEKMRERAFVALQQHAGARSAALALLQLGATA